MTTTIDEIKSNYILEGVGKLINSIREVIQENTRPDDALNYYMATKQELMENNHLVLLEWADRTGVVESHRDVINEIKTLKPKPDVAFKTATFRAENISTLTIPDEIDVEILETSTGLEYRFDIDNTTINWLAESLNTEPYYLADYDHITTYRF